MNQKVAKAVELLYLDSAVFNEISGSATNNSLESFQLQRDLIKEEFLELSEGLDTNDLEEQLDGVVDVLVTAFGYLQKLANTYDIDVAEACNRVASNNLTKYPVDEQVAYATVEMYDAQGRGATYYEKSEDHGVYVIRDALTNKVKKPKGFVPVSLADLIPVRH